MDEAPTKFIVEERKRSKGKTQGPPLLKFELPGKCKVEDLKIGKHNEKAATLMDMVNLCNNYVKC